MDAPPFAAGTTPPPRPTTPPPSPFHAGAELSLTVLPLPGVSPLIGDRVPLLATTDAAAARLRAAVAAGRACVLVGPAPAAEGGGADATRRADWTSPNRGAPGMSPRGPGLPALVACVVVHPESASVATATVVARGVAVAPARRRGGAAPPAVRVVVLPSGDDRLPREASGGGGGTATAAPRLAWRAADAAAAVAALETAWPADLPPLPPPPPGATPATRLACVAAALPLSPRFRAGLLAAPSVAAAAATLAAAIADGSATRARCRRCGSTWAERAGGVPAAAPPSAGALAGNGGVCANPLGHAHAVTLLPAAGGGGQDQTTPSNLNGLFVDGLPVPHASWLPPWLWSVAFCAACGQHAGWLFTPPPPDRRADFLAGEPGLMTMEDALLAAGATGGGVLGVRRAALASPDSDDDEGEESDEEEDE